MPIVKSLNQRFFQKWNSHMAYVLGFFAADGAMILNNRGGHFIEFHSTDKNILVQIRAALGSNHKIGVRARSDAWKTAYRLQIGSISLFEDLTKLGLVQNKSNVLGMPFVPKKYLSHYIRGYFDGDGNVYFRRHWVQARRKKRWVFSSRFTSGSARYLKELHNTLLAAGLRGGFIITKNRGYELVFSHKDSLALYHLMYDTVSATDIFLPRKRRLFRKAVKTLYAAVAQR